MVHDVGGDDLVELFRNKTLGGQRNKNGRDFEVAYGVQVVICEMAALVKAVINGTPPDHLRDRCFAEQPIAMMDDFYMSGLKEHFFAQLKSGTFTISDITDDLKVQIDLDDAIDFKVSYKAVLGNYTISNGTIEDIESFDRTTVEVFAFSRNYFDNVALNGALYDAMTALTGHIEIACQQTAYRSFFSLF